MISNLKLLSLKQLQKFKARPESKGEKAKENKTTRLRDTQFLLLALNGRIFYNSDNFKWALKSILTRNSVLLHYGRYNYFVCVTLHIKKYAIFDCVTY